MSKSPDRHRHSSSRTAGGSAPGSSTTCADTTFIPEVIVQACRSWTSATPWASGCAPGPRRCRCPSGSPRAGRRPRRAAGARSAAGSAADRAIEATASACSQPVTAMTSAATMTARGPSEVAHDLEVGAAHRQAVPLGVARSSRRTPLATQPERRDGEHQARTRPPAARSAGEALDQDDERDEEQQDGVDDRGEDLETAGSRRSAPRSPADPRTRPRGGRARSRRRP